jgi:hypothetical protein
MNNKQTIQIGSLYPLSFFESHLDPSQHFMDFFCFKKCFLLNCFGMWTALLHLFLSFTPHHELGPHLGRYKYVKGIKFHVKESSFNRCWQKICQLLNFNRLFNFFYFYIILFNYSSSSKSLIIMNVGVGGENVFEGFTMSFQIILPH